LAKRYEDLFKQMEREMERMTHEALQQFDRVRSRARIWQPRADVCETKDSVYVTVELAGLSADTISKSVAVTLAPDGRSLKISGRREEPPCKDERLRCFQLEIYYGAFERVIPLPSDVSFHRDRLSAAYRDGFLTVELPKGPVEAPRSIPVESPP
jgi:HSP20 family protein